MSKIPEEDSTIELVARRFRALSEPQRLRIIQLLEGGERTVNDISAALDATQSNVSKHLRALAMAGLVHGRKEGNTVRYSISDPVVLELCDLVCQSAEAEVRRNLAGFSAAPSKKVTRRTR